MTREKILEKLEQALYKIYMKGDLLDNRLSKLGNHEEDIEVLSKCIDDMKKWGGSNVNKRPSQIIYAEAVLDKKAQALVEDKELKRFLK
jgi:hypothetical protein